MSTPKADLSSEAPSLQPFRWFKRLTAAIFLLVVLVALLWSAWWWEGRRRLAAELAAIKSRGEAWEWSDFSEPPVTSGQNAADCYWRATRLVSVDNADLDKLSERWNLPMTPPQMEVLRAIVARNEEAWREVRAATSLPGVNWGVDVHADYQASCLLMPSTKIRSLANVGRLRILLDHDTGNDAEAVTDIQALLHLALAARDYSGIYGWLMASSIDGGTAAAIQEIAPDLAVGVAPAAMPQVFRDVIAALLDERGRRAQGILATETYRRDQYDQICQPGAISGPPAWSPMGTYLQVKQLQSWESIVQAARQDRWPEVLWRDPWHDRKSGDTSVVEFTWDLWQEGIAGSANSRILLMDFRAVVDRRMAAVALALRWYAVDHAGTLPATLHDLVPAYLPELPRDPFAATDQPIKWVRADPQPRLYSVGEDGVDDGGSMEMPHDYSTFNRWAAKDYLFFLSRPTTRLKSAPSPTGPAVPLTGPAVVPGN